MTTLTVHARTVVTGIVRDAITGAPLSGATTQVADGFQGTVTNVEGRFEIALDTLPATLRISMIGYTSHRVLIDEETPVMQHILLVPAVYDLDPIIVTEHESVTDIMRRVIERKQQWRSQLKELRADAYSRFTMENEDGIVFILEGLADASWDHKNGWKAVVKSYRKTSNLFTDEDLDDFKTLDDLAADALVVNLYDDNILLSDHRLMGVTHPDALNKYEFTIEGQRLLDDRLVYDIGVRPKSRLFSGFIGRISVIDRTYAMIEADLRPGPAFIFPPPIQSYNLSAKQQFAQFGDGFWLPVGLQMHGDLKFGIIGFMLPVIKGTLIAHLSDYKVFGIQTTTASDSLPPRVPSPDREIQSQFNDSLFIHQGKIIPLSEQEQTALDNIDSTMTFFKAFEPKGFIAGQLKKRGVFDEAEKRDNDAVGELSLSGRRRKDTRGADSSLVDIDYTSDVWYNRVDAAHLGLSTAVHIRNTPITLTGTGAYNTGTKRWTYGGDVTLLWGERKRYAFLARYMNGSDTRYRSLLYTPKHTSMVTLLGGEDYFDYFQNERVNFLLGDRIGRRRAIALSAGLNIERHHSLSKTTDYALFGNDHIQRQNPAIVPGDFRSFTLRAAYGRKPDPFSPEKVGYFAVDTEISHPDLLSGDFSFTRTRLTYIRRINTFFRRRMFPNTLDLRVTGGFSTGALPPQRFGIIDGSLSAASQYGVLKSLRQQPYEGEHYAAIFWDHNFRTVPFEMLGLMSLARRGIGINIHGGHGRTWISNDRLAALTYLPQYQDHFHHEVGISLTGLFYFFRLDFTKRLDTTGFFIGVGLGPGFIE